LLSEFEISIMF